MIQFAGQNAMAPGMPRQENHFPPAQLAGQKFIGWLPKGRFHLDPFFFGKTLNIVEAAAPDDSNAMLCHGLETIYGPDRFDTDFMKGSE